MTRTLAGMWSSFVVRARALHLPSLVHRRALAKHLTPRIVAKRARDVDRSHLRQGFRQRHERGIEVRGGARACASEASVRGGIFGAGNGAGRLRGSANVRRT